MSAPSFLELLQKWDWLPLKIIGTGKPLKLSFIKVLLNVILMRLLQLMSHHSSLALTVKERDGTSAPVNSKARAIVA